MSTQTPAAQRLLKEADAARILNVQVATLRRWRWIGRGPCFYKIGAAVRYDPADLDEFNTSGRRRSTSDPGPARSPRP